jgi:hypothetical protein
MLDKSNSAEWLAGWRDGALDVRCGNVPTRFVAETVLWNTDQCGPHGRTWDAYSYGYVAALSAAVGAL